MEQNYWQKSEEHLPRFWLELETENLLIPWETVQAVSLVRHSSNASASVSCTSLYTSRPTMTVHTAA